ncbi:MAG TPA: fatty acid desaturase [Caulobacteraceae bacterium]
MSSITQDPRALKKALATYQRPSHGRSFVEILITAGPLAVLWGLAWFAVDRHQWWGVLLTVPAAFFLVRLFMIQHDCGHGAFFRHKPLNDWVGRIIGILTVTPYDYWRRTHAIHHATSGNLDRRWLGAVETLTVEEYQALPPIKRLGYRLYRNPVVLFVIGPAYMFILQHRLPIGLMKERSAWISVMGANLGIAALVFAAIYFGGAGPFLMVHLPILLLSASIGVWLFYVQHQFEGAFWARNDDWTLHEASLKGSSHLQLPPVLSWFAANIGVHHVHHVGSKIPYYRLPQVLKDHPELDEMSRVGFWESFRSVRLALWDEAKGRLVSFNEARRHRAALSAH